MDSNMDKTPQVATLEESGAATGDSSCLHSKQKDSGEAWEESQGGYQQRAFLQHGQNSSHSCLIGFGDCSVFFSYAVNTRL